MRFKVLPTVDKQKASPVLIAANVELGEAVVEFVEGEVEGAVVGGVADAAGSGVDVVAGGEGVAEAECVGGGEVGEDCVSVAVLEAVFGAVGLRVGGGDDGGVFGDGGAEGGVLFGFEFGEDCGAVEPGFHLAHGDVAFAEAKFAALPGEGVKGLYFGVGEEFDGAVVAGAVSGCERGELGGGSWLPVEQGVLEKVEGFVLEGHVVQAVLAVGFFDDGDPESVGAGWF
jgi:hypothetical protein